MKYPDPLLSSSVSGTIKSNNYNISDDKAPIELMSKVIVYLIIYLSFIL